MNKKSVILIAVLSLIVGLILGYFIYSKTVARFNTVTTACVIMNQAVDKKMLTPEQVKELGALTGKELKTHYASVADKLSISDAQADVASEGSQCSQFLVGVHQAQ